MDADQKNKLWETYHHIAKLHELGQDERGNIWHQASWGHPRGLEPAVLELEPPVLELELVQGDELCGTAQCFAGWYGTLHGLRRSQHSRVEPAPGVVQHVSDFTEEDAGLEHIQAQALFTGSNTLPRIADLLAKYTGEDRR